MLVRCCGVRHHSATLMCGHDQLAYVESTLDMSCCDFSCGLHVNIVVVSHLEAVTTSTTVPS